VPCRRDLPPIVAAGDLYLAGSEGWWCELGAGLAAGAVGGEVRVNIERISAVTLKVASMANSVRFYRDVLGMQIIYGGEEDCFSSFGMKEGKGPILNLEQGHSVTDWGRLLVRCGRGCDLGIPVGKRISSGECAGRSVGRTIFPYARSGWPRVVVCTSIATSEDLVRSVEPEK
jgi:catechol 2,3-dioxygenase-like lactoylglutathione lyase family enzyme